MLVRLTSSPDHLIGRVFEQFSFSLSFWFLPLFLTFCSLFAFGSVCFAVGCKTCVILASYSNTK